ncbi:MAG: hypothetical protein NTU57_04815 [Candidatus Aenigmarchaeota archaeon]|nr:hypothetical protein [Candidatus Aenigmarchaeota archaeon]
MKEVFFIHMENYSKAKNVVFTDDVVARQTVNFREARALGMQKDGYYLEIDGPQEAIHRAKELLAEIAKVVEHKEKEEVLHKIKAEEDKAAEGFGSLFG